MKASIFRLILPALLLTLEACNGSQFEYSDRSCYVLFDNATYLDPTIASAMTPYSNVFVTISETVHDGARYFRFASNQGGAATESIFNAIDQRHSIIIGMNGGLIVGYGALSDPLTFYAFDRECPNCFDPARLPVRSYPLQTASNGITTCATCKRQYDLNNMGIIVAGDPGNKLTRYRAETTGPHGVLFVH
ncbi:MAG: hypothetical protein MSD82_12285 [Prevotella sp.]|nr:hypothetical protein [Prevotella sp.]